MMLGETKEEAIRNITPMFEEHAKMFGPLGFLPGIDGRTTGDDRRVGRLARQGGPDGGGLHRNRGLGSPARRKSLLAS